jgi:copper chaperone CopZ
MWRTKGVKDVDTNWMLHNVWVTYDDQVTSIEEILKVLAKEGFFVEGQPEFLK